MDVITFESEVTWRKARPGPPRYPVTGVAKAFANVEIGGDLVPAASVLVTVSAGIYRQGDVITVPVAELEPAAHASAIR